VATIIRFRGQRNLDECKTARGSVPHFLQLFTQETIRTLAGAHKCGKLVGL